MKLTELVAPWRHAWACLALLALIGLASCDTQSDVKPAAQSAKDSTSHNLVAGDPPIKPSGPGGGP